VSVVSAVERTVAEVGDADEILRAVVRLLVEQPGLQWAGIRFVEGDERAP
jgi:hypothetical protein